MVSFGLEDFAKRYADLKPSQFVDVAALAGDKSDNIPGFSCMHGFQLSAVAIKHTKTIASIDIYVQNFYGANIRPSTPVGAFMSKISSYYGTFFIVW